jgi:hypothetical protein
MENINITNTFSNGYQNVIGLPRLGGPACLPVEQRKLGWWHNCR